VPDLDEGPAKEFGSFGGAFLLPTQSPIGARQEMAEPRAARRPGSPVGGYGCPNLARVTGTRSPMGGRPPRREGRPGPQVRSVRRDGHRRHGAEGHVGDCEGSAGCSSLGVFDWPPIDAVAPLERDVASAGEVIPVYGDAVRRSRDSARRMGINSSFVDIVARHLTQRVFEGNGGVLRCAAFLGTSEERDPVRGMFAYRARTWRPPGIPFDAYAMMEELDASSTGPTARTLPPKSPPSTPPP
jgi:hypothetical protein